VTTIPTITALPTPPSTDDPANFSTPADAFLGCLFSTSDAADASLRVDLGGRRIIKKKK